MLLLCRTWAQMVSRFEALLQSYREHCVSRSGLMLHLHNTDALSMQEVQQHNIHVNMRCTSYPLFGLCRMRAYCFICKSR